MLGSPERKSKIRKHASFGAVALLLALFILTTLCLVTSLVLIQGGIIAKWVKGYLSLLQKQQPNNPFLLLFSKNIDQILRKKYLFLYAKKLFIFLGITIAISIAVSSLIILVNHIYLKKSNKHIKNDVDQNQVVTFCLCLSFFVCLLISLCILYLHHAFKNIKDVPTVMISYLDQCVPNQGNNAFLEIWKGIIKETFKINPKQDLLIRVRDNSNILLFVALGIGLFLMISLSIYLGWSQCRNNSRLEGANVVTTHETDPLSA